MLEGALAYLYELGSELEKLKSLEDLKRKLNEDAKVISGQLACCLWNDLKQVYSGLEEEKEKV